MSNFLEKMWYGTHPAQRVLRPFSWAYSAISHIRRWYLTTYSCRTFPVPVIVVGNLTVGGVGKTPFVIELARQCQKKGLNVGIVSRGYGSQVKTYPYEVQKSDSADKVGDEPLLIAEKTRCPVVIAKKRTQAVQYLLEKYHSQIIISDDGLQHYRMGRAIEIVVIDATRGLGNGLCLPAGPLRESESRLKQVDFVISNEGHWQNAYLMKLKPGQITQMTTGQTVTPNFFTNKVAAVAAIGNPQRFYSTLTQLGIESNPYYFPDHYRFKPHDFSYSESQVIMTEKDAVKCRAFSTEKMYFLPVDAVLCDAFWEALWSHQHLQGYC